MSEFFSCVYYSILGWITVKIFFNLFIAFKTFVFPRVFGELDLVEKYGSWAGSTDGIGKAYAKELAKRGLNIVLISRNKEKLQYVASEIGNEFKVETKIIVSDFREGSSLHAHIKKELENIPVGILVNNVGMILSRPYYLDEVPVKLVHDMVYVNITSALMMINLILPKMKQKKKGAVVNISSASETTPLPFSTVYSSSKAFLKHLSYLLHHETRDNSITVQLLSPFFVKTNMTSSLPRIHRSQNIWSPDGETYAKHAIKTLGFSQHTTGYWPHGILYSISDMIPSKIRIRLANKMTLPFRRKYEKMKLAKLNSIREKNNT